MVRRRRLELTSEEVITLTQVRDHDPHPQMRERACALLKIASGVSPHAVAREGLLRPRDPDSVYGWLTCYQQEGVVGLRAHLHGAKPRGRLRRRAHTGAAPSATRGGGSEGDGVA